MCGCLIGSRLGWSDLTKKNKHLSPSISVLFHWRFLCCTIKQHQNQMDVMLTHHNIYIVHISIYDWLPVCSYTVHTHSIQGRRGQKKAGWFGLEKKKHHFFWARIRGKNYALILIQYFHLLIGLSKSRVPLNLSFSLQAPMVELAFCNYSHRYWGHLAVVSSPWKTELLPLYKGQVFFIFSWSSIWIDSRIPTSNWMCRQTETSEKKDILNVSGQTKPLIK